MATAQDYRQARRIGQISLTDLIARNIAEGGGFGSVGKAVSQKFAAKKTRIREAFDPLNIASMMVGRTKLGTAILGRIMGRSAEDIQYFARKGAGREAAYDPFFSRVSPGSLQPVKQSEGMADIFAKLYNLIKKNIDDETRRKEIEKNFREEQALEDERRHKELLAAITGDAKPKATLVDKKEGGSILDFIKGMFGEFGKFVDKLKEGLGSLFTALSPLLLLLGGGLMAILRGLTSLGGVVIRLLGALLMSPMGQAILAGVLITWLSSEIAKAIGNWEKGKLEEKGGKPAVEAQEKLMKAPAATPIQESYDEFGGTATSLESDVSAAERDAAIKEKQYLVYQKMKARGYKSYKKFGRNEYYFENSKGEEAADSVMKEVGAEADQEIEERRRKGIANPYLSKEGQAKQLKEYKDANKPASAPGTTPTPKTSTPPAPTATPSPVSAAETTTPMPSTPSIPPVMTATTQNMELQDDYNISLSDAPVIFNKSSTNGISLPGEDPGTVTGAASIRDDALENIMANLRRRSTVM